jgi:alpha-ketoglutarate-dependent taurine dioxygenase
VCERQFFTGEFIVMQEDDGSGHIYGIRSYLFPGKSIPLVIEASASHTQLRPWVQMHRAFIDEQLKRFGALLFKNFRVQDEEAPTILEDLCGALISYIYRSTPRTQVAKNIYTATEYPANQIIPQHNENAYALDWPMRLAFFCSFPAEQGGETPIADSVKVTRRISNTIINKFIAKQIMYVRNYEAGMDLSWQTVFQTETRQGVEEYCTAHSINCEWLKNDTLRTWQVCPAVVPHPLTRQKIWFNQVHLFHISNLNDKIRGALLNIYKESELPRNAYYGDGEPIEPDALKCIRQAYDDETISFIWQRGDVMLLDNMLVSHGRKAFTGKRRILVAMGNAYSSLQTPARVTDP